MNDILKTRIVQVIVATASLLIGLAGTATAYAVAPPLDEANGVCSIASPSTHGTLPAWHQITVNSCTSAQARAWVHYHPSASSSTVSTAYGPYRTAGQSRTSLLGSSTTYIEGGYAVQNL